MSDKPGEVGDSDPQSPDAQFKRAQAIYKEAEFGTCTAPNFQPRSLENLSIGPACKWCGPYRPQEEN